MRAVAPEFEEEVKKVICGCLPFAEDRLREILRSERLKSVQEVLEIYGNGPGCEVCKPALSYMLDMLWCGDHDEDRSARFINDRVHANIQKDGTFSVIPRIRGGVTSAAELRRIADVADKYHVPMVKITGSQRIDLLGVKKEDLPKIWADLDMPSGQAYTKGVRMVKTCVGTDFCRFGTQDSTAVGIELERRFEQLFTPHKVKMAAVGCPRNCAEATVKDIGLVGQEGGWQVVVGGAAGKSVRKADLLTTVETSEAALEAAELFFQYYRESANYLERTYDFVERLGIEKVRKETVYAPETVKQGLRDRFARSKARAVRPMARRARAQTPDTVHSDSTTRKGGRMNGHRWVRVTGCESVPLREGRAVTLAGREIAIFNLGDRFLATDNQCPHQGGPLCDGIVAGDSVVCPLHAWKVRLDSGSVERPASRDACITTYPTRVEDGIVWLGLPLSLVDAPEDRGARTVKTQSRAVADVGEDRVLAIWQQRAGRPGRTVPAASFDGRRVLTLESRRAPELALLIMNYGGTPVVAPSLREVPLESNHQALTFAEDLIQQRFGMVVLMTGVGVRLLDQDRRTCVRPRGVRSGTGADADRRARSQARGRASRNRGGAVGHRARARTRGASCWPRWMPVSMTRRSPTSAWQSRSTGWRIPNWWKGWRRAEPRWSTVPIYRWSMPEDVAPLRAPCRRSSETRSTS